ncbi:MAG: ABC transporter substrate-binding protein [Clostridiaceae bacterium]
MSEKFLGGLDLLALLPCPLKVPVELEFKTFIENNNISIKYLLEGNANSQLDYNETIESYEDINEIPDIVISSGVNSFYHKRFIDKFISKNYFYDATINMDEKFSGCNIKDPNGNYSVFAANILVMVVDTKALGTSPVPSKFSDLIKPEYYKKVALRGRDDSFCETTLLTIFKNSGYEGIAKLGKSVKYGWHPSQMVKMAGSGRDDAPAVSVMPYFFAHMLENKKGVTIVWPEDGAIVSPVTMLVKKSAEERLKKIIEFFAGSKLGDICAGAFFPASNSEAKRIIPDTASLNWIGWDYIKERDIGTLIKEINGVFMESYRG